MKRNLRVMLCVALLTAIEIVLSRFCSISTPIVKIGFAFVPVSVCAMLFGPVWAGICGGLADLLGAVLFPIGPYFPGFTLSAALTGVVFGLCLRGKREGWKHIALAVGINNLGVSLLLSTLWLSMLYGSPYLSLIPWRLVQVCTLMAVEFVVIRLIQKPITAAAGWLNR